MKSNYIIILIFFSFQLNLIGQEKCDFIDIIKYRTYFGEYNNGKMYFEDLMTQERNDNPTEIPRRFYNAYSQTFKDISKFSPNLCLLNITRPKNINIREMKFKWTKSGLNYLILNYNVSYQGFLLNENFTKFYGLNELTLPKNLNYLSINNYNMPLDQLLSNNSSKILNLTNNKYLEFFPILNSSETKLVFLDEIYKNTPEVVLSKFLNKQIIFYYNSYFSLNNHLNWYGNNLSKSLVEIYDFDYQIKLYINEFQSDKNLQLDTLLRNKTFNYNPIGGKYIELNEFEVWNLIEVEKKYKKYEDDLKIKITTVNDKSQMIEIKDSIGNILLKCTINQNRINGPLYIFFPNGNIKEIRYYKMGKPISIWLKKSIYGKNIAKIDYRKKIKYSYKYIDFKFKMQQEGI